MRSLRLLRLACIAFAFFALIGGYAAHQYSLFTGNLERWNDAISGPNIALGWLLLSMAALLAFAPEDETS